MGGRVMALLVLVVAMLPHLLAPGDFWTADEGKKWSVRSDAFLVAMQQGDYAATNQVGHPGVTTMWLGAGGTWLHGALRDAGLLRHDPTGFWYRMLLRLPVAMTAALGIALAALLLRALFAPRVALLAALLMAADPFLVAHRNILHVDALLTVFALLALLLALWAFRLEDVPSHAPPAPGTAADVRWPALLASGVAAGLALLTKSPALLLLPLVGLIALVGLMLRGLEIWRVVRALLVWGALLMLVWVALWPAAWVNLPHALATVLVQAVEDGGSAHGWGNYFLGQMVADPGARFYPVALVLRLTPLSMAGIFAAGVALVPQPLLPLRRAPRMRSPALALLLLYALLLVGIMSLLPKKFDRYVLPVFPVLDCVAAMGLAGTAHLLWQRIREQPRVPHVLRGAAARGALWLLLLAGMAAPLVASHPYELAWYNPLVGGAPMAAHAIVVGWGEGLEQAGDYIRTHTTREKYTVAAWYEWAVTPTLGQSAIGLDNALKPGRVDYVVLYINQVQRGIYPELVPLLRERGALLHTVRIGGIDYARIYQLRQPRQHTLNADFGARLRLVACDTAYAETTPLPGASGVLTVTTQWQAVDTTTSDDVRLFIHVFDDAGTLVGQADVPPGGALPVAAWPPRQFIDWAHPVPLHHAPAGDESPRRLWVSLGLYRAASGERLPLRMAGGGPVPGAPDDGSDTVMLRVEF